MVNSLKPRDKRVAVQVSMSPREKDRYRNAARRAGLSFSLLMRLAASDYIKRNKLEGRK